MSVKELRIQNVRCFAEKSFFLSPKLNFIVAANGAGKTSLLESIYLLSCGHSFRTREISPLMRIKQKELCVFARLHNEEIISIRKSLPATTQIKINSEWCRKTSELARHLPCQIYYQDIYALMDSGPSVRRAMMDWGMFHVEHHYHTLIKTYNNLIKQRNALLRQKQKSVNFVPWDKQISDLGEQLHRLRKAYVKTLSNELQKLLKTLTQTQCEVRYFKGWDKLNKGLSLYEQLQSNFEKDTMRGYTSVGAHQADLYFDSAENQAKKVLSRGQQKIVLIALKLAQSKLIGKKCVHLCDDVFSELDSVHIENFLNTTSSLNEQFVITLLPDDLEYIAIAQTANIMKL